MASVFDQSIVFVFVALLNVWFVIFLEVPIFVPAIFFRMIYFLIPPIPDSVYSYLCCSMARPQPGSENQGTNNRSV